MEVPVVRIQETMAVLVAVVVKPVTMALPAVDLIFSAVVEPAHSQLEVPVVLTAVERPVKRVKQMDDTPVVTQAIMLISPQEPADFRVEEEAAEITTAVAAVVAAAQAGMVVVAVNSKETPAEAAEVVDLLTLMEAV